MIVQFYNLLYATSGFSLHYTATLSKSHCTISARKERNHLPSKFFTFNTDFKSVSTVRIKSRKPQTEVTYEMVSGMIYILFIGVLPTWQSEEKPCSRAISGILWICFLSFFGIFHLSFVSFQNKAEQTAESTDQIPTQGFDRSKIENLDFKHIFRIQK